MIIDRSAFRSYFYASKLLVNIVQVPGRIEPDDEGIELANAI